MVYAAQVCDKTARLGWLRFMREVGQQAATEARW
jgi:hypothetical protein